MMRQGEGGEGGGRRRGEGGGRRRGGEEEEDDRNIGSPRHVWTPTPASSLHQAPLQQAAAISISTDHYPATLTSSSCARLNSACIVVHSQRRTHLGWGVRTHAHAHAHLVGAWVGAVRAGVYACVCVYLCVQYYHY